MKLPTPHTAKDANRRKHTAKELTTDFGINTYDFTARSQYPMASRFDQPDKKSGDYKWLSPYIFCAADPINFSDPTGNDYELIIDDENKTMTVSAVYYACTPDMKSLNKAIAFWNGQSGIHQVGEYTIMFELETVEVKDYGYDGSGNKVNDNTRRSAAKLATAAYNNTSDTKKGNSFTVHTKMSMSKAGAASHNHIDINKETAQETTYLHEIGHTLGINHDSNGIMTESANDLARGKFLTGNNIVEMVKNTFSRDAERSVGKGYLKIINKTIERLYLFNYHKLPR